MFLLSFIRFLFGYIKFRAEGGSPERFLNQAARDGVSLWKIQCRDGCLTACVSRRRYGRLSKAAGMAGSRLVVVKRKGLPFIFSKYRRRRGILAGILIFAGIVWFFSCFVWSVEIHGNSRVSTEEISRALAEAGVRPGVFRLTLNLRRAENQALIGLPDVSWLSVNLRGSKAIVEIKERIFPPEIVPVDRPCNIKASQTGQIVSVESYEGMAVVKKGDSVKKGDVVVSGIVEESTGVLRLVHAKAKVIAKTERQLDVTIPFQTMEQQMTGKSVTIRQLNLAGMTIPLSFRKSPKGNYVSTMEVHQASIFGLTLPVGVKTYFYSEYRVRNVVLTPAQALSKAKALLQKKESTEFAGVTIQSKQYNDSKDKNGLSLFGKYKCIENIAYEEEINIS